MMSFQFWGGGVRDPLCSGMSDLLHRPHTCSEFIVGGAKNKHREVGHNRGSTCQKVQTCQLLVNVHTPLRMCT